ASVKPRPRRKASKNRGGSKMRSLTSVTWSPSISTLIAPSPSTRARYSVAIVLTRRSAIRAHFVEFGDVERPEHALDALLVETVGAQPGAERSGVRRLHRAEAAVAAPVVAGAERAAPGVRDGAEARRPVSDGDADVAAALALGADAGRGDVRAAAVQVGGENL